MLEVFAPKVQREKEEGHGALHLCQEQDRRYHISHTVIPTDDGNELGNLC